MQGCGRRVVITGFVALSGCTLLAPPWASLPDLPPARPDPYILGTGDDLTIRVYDQPQLSGDFIVDDSGQIDFPLLGLLPAGGGTTDALVAAIAGGLQRRQLIIAPSVAVEISHFRPFYILGEVATPGQYPYRPRMTVLTAISIAGGFTDRAAKTYVSITRGGGSGVVAYRAKLFALAQPGDVITVFERNF